MLVFWIIGCAPAPAVPTSPSSPDDGASVTVEHVTFDESDSPPDGGTDSGATPPDETTDTTETTGGTPPDDTPPDDTPPEEIDPCAAAAGGLALGDDHDVEIDAYTGDGETTEPKTDANDGAHGDNPEFQRHNVARGHCGGTSCYWYSSSHQEAGEPDPSGSQWVDYTPDFSDLGVGWYQITARYRQTENRADYEAWYRVSHRDGDTLTEVDQRDGTDDVSFDLGTYWMCPGSVVRVEDPGSESITFNDMSFAYLGG